MQQHPIPQDITNYKFHLIGKMTLKQFGELAAGAILAFIIYSTNLIGIIKWPLILFTVGLAAMVAFVPIEERPMDHWIITFFKNLWKPTKFYWKRKSQIPEVFSHQAKKIDPQYSNPEVDLSPARKQRINEYLYSIPQNEELDDWDKARNQEVGRLISEFEQVEVDPEEIEIKKKTEKPKLKTRVRNLAPQKASSRLDKSELEEKEKVEIVAAPKTEAENNFEQLTQVEEKETVDAFANLAGNKNEPIFESNNQAIAENENSDTNEITPESDNKAEDRVAKLIAAEKNKKSEETTEEPAVQETKNNENLIESSFNKDLPLPNRSNLPNQLAGMIFNQAGEIIPNALIEIKNEQGQSSRIVKSNEFGQYFIRTPLKNGDYQIHIEHPDYQFQAFELEIKGKILAPLEIRALT